MAKAFENLEADQAKSICRPAAPGARVEFVFEETYDDDNEDDLKESGEAAELNLPVDDEHEEEEEELEEEELVEESIDVPSSKTLSTTYASGKTAVTTTQTERIGKIDTSNKVSAKLAQQRIKMIKYLIARCKQGGGRVGEGGRVYQGGGRVARVCPDCVQVSLLFESRFSKDHPSYKCYQSPLSGSDVFQGGEGEKVSGFASPPAELEPCLIEERVEKVRPKIDNSLNTAVDGHCYILIRLQVVEERL